MSPKVHKYDSERISVTWDAGRCIHAAECLRWLPAVFDTDKTPWVQPRNAEPDDVAETVMLCPTGALHYSRKDGGEAEPKPEDNVILVMPNGPLYVHADAVMLSPEKEVTLEDTRIALCRCGESGNKPFCDNSHLRTSFRDHGVMKENKLLTDDPPPETTRLTLTPNRNGSLRVQGPVTIHFLDGTDITGNRCSLCRCGHSKNKPFCDGTHKEIGFAGE
jgi:CDGSH-type Zn-finger protein/uncharacterized Fe-S cluster protein YjdI